MQKRVPAIGVGLAAADVIVVLNLNGYVGDAEMISD